MRWLGPREWPASLEGIRAYMDPIFGAIAPRYDLVSRLLSFGQEGRWKRRAVGLIPRAERPARILDLATGTGGFVACLDRAGHRAPIVALDRSREMLAIARRRWEGRGPGTRRTVAATPPEAGGRPGATRVAFIRGDLASLPFAERTFDLVTLGYGLRYVPDLRPIVGQVLRLLRPGGRFVCLDLDAPSRPMFRRAYLGYLLVLGSLWGLAFHGRPGEYWHIAESLRAFPGSAAVMRAMHEAGFVATRCVSRLGGAAMIVTGRRPPGATADSP
jgi:demethylmenaquinone methyltransferase/2-methoxy-6-polyprenyl-1,4-benzoquinol methylase